MTKAKTQQIETSAYHEPTLTIPADFTALHIASICAELYSCTAPTGLMDEFTICEEGDFAMYNVHDQFDMAEHYFYTAFSIGESVKRNPQYSVAGYTLYGGGLNTNTNGDKLGFMCNNIYADSSMLNVFLDEDEVKTFVQNYNNDDEE